VKFQFKLLNVLWNDVPELPENILTHNFAQRHFCKLKLKRKEVSKLKGKPVGAKNLAVRLVLHVFPRVVAERYEEQGALALRKGNNMDHKHSKLEVGSLIFLRNHLRFSHPANLY